MIKYNIRNYAVMCIFELILIFLNIFSLRNEWFQIATMIAIALAVLRIAYALICNMKFWDGIIIFLSGRLILHFVSYPLKLSSEVAGFLSLERVLYIIIVIILIDVFTYVLINGLKYLGNRMLN